MGKKSACFSLVIEYMARNRGHLSPRYLRSGHSNNVLRIPEYLQISISVLFKRAMKMATVKNTEVQKRSRTVDYRQLNSFSSAVLYDTARRSKKSKLFEVERVITRRRIRHVSCKYVIL